MGLDLRSGLRAGCAALALSAGVAACSSNVRPLVAALVFAIGLASCGSRPLHDALDPHFVSGNDAADRIDVQIGGMIAAHHAGVIVGRARCPYLIDLSGNRVGRCMLPVTGGNLRIDVERRATRVMRGTPPWVTARDALIVRRDIQREIADYLETKYGVRFGVRCPGSAVRIVSDPSTMPCALIFAGANRGYAHVRLDAGVLSATGPAALPTLERVFARYGTTQAKGRGIIDQGWMQQYIRAIAGDWTHAALARRGLIHAARCPARIALHDRAYATCSVLIGSHPVQYGMLYSKARGLDVGTDSIVEVIPDVRDLAERYYTHVLPLIDPAEARSRPRVRTDCGADVVAVLDRDGAIPCTVQIGKRSIPFQVRFGNDSRDLLFKDAPLAPERGDQTVDALIERKAAST